MSSYRGLQPPFERASTLRQSLGVTPTAVFFCQLTRGPTAGRRAYIYCGAWLPYPERATARCATVRCGRADAENRLGRARGRQSRPDRQPQTVSGIKMLSGWVCVSAGRGSTVRGLYWGAGARTHKHGTAQRAVEWVAPQFADRQAVGFLVLPRALPSSWGRFLVCSQSPVKTDKKQRKKHHFSQKRSGRGGGHGQAVP